MKPSPENRPESWSIASDLDGFFVIDADGFDLTPTWRSTSFWGAKEKLRTMVNEALDWNCPLRPTSPGNEAKDRE